MADELELELEGDQEEIISRKDIRIKSLSDKVKITSEERDAKAKEAEEAKTRAEKAEKDADFFKNFNSVSTKYQGSSEYQDKIREKVALGLDVEEATMLVMTKEGKYVPPALIIERESAIGGSAATGIHDSIEKKPKEMSKDEIRSQLLDLESRGEKLI